MNRRLVIPLAVLVLLLIAGAVGLVVSGHAPEEPVAEFVPPPPPTPAEEDDDDVTRRRVEKPPPARVVPQAPVPTENPVPALGGKGVLAGVVLSSIDRAVVEKAVVEVVEILGRTVARTKTDRAGRYAFAGLPDGVPLVVRFTAAGYLTGYACDVRLRPLVLLKKDAQLLRSPLVEVHVRARSGDRSGEGAQVVVRLEGREVLRTETDERGEVELGLPSFGDFEILVGGGDQYAPAEPQRIQVWPGMRPARVRVDVHEGGELVVRAQMPDGAPAVNAEVVIGSGFLRAKSQRSNSEGRATFPRVTPGVPHTIDVHHGGSDDSAPVLRGVSSGTVKDGYITDVDVRMRTTGFVAGRITDTNGEPVPSAEVRVLAENGYEVLRATTDEEGRYDIAGLPEGELRYVFRARGYGELVTTEVARDETARRDDRVVELERVLGLRVIGRVTDPTGTAIPGAAVQSYPGGERATANAYGEYTLEWLPPDEAHRIRARAAGYRAPPGTSEPVVGNPGDVLTVDLVLDRSPHGKAEERRTARRAAFFGTVVDPMGRPVFGAEVRAGDTQTTTDGAGAFRLRDVPFPAGVAYLPTLEILPTQQHLTPTSFGLSRPDGDEKEIGKVVLHERPFAVVRVADVKRLGNDVGDELTFTYAETDRFLGRRVDALTPVIGISYDRTWLHVPRDNAWRYGGDGKVWVAAPSEHGPLTDEQEFRIHPGGPVELTADFARSRTDVSVRLDKNFIRGRAKFVFKRSRFRVADSTRDPFESMQIAREFELEASHSRYLEVSLPRGLWELTLIPPKGSRTKNLTVELDTETTKPRIDLKTLQKQQKKAQATKR